MISSPIEISDALAETLLTDLVSTPSPSHEEQAAVQHLVDWMQAHGYDDAFVDEAGNAVGFIGQGERDVILLGHIDTFTGNPPVWTDGRLLYGRGTVDAKGPLCTFAVAASRAQIPADVRLIVIGAVEEEAASSKGARYVARQYRPEACIIGEPSNWDRMTLGYKGRLLLEWRWDGAMAHSAGDVTTAPEHAVNYWQFVQVYVASVSGEETRLFDKLDATLQQINSGQVGAYGWAEMMVGFRLPPGINPEQLAQDLPPQDGATVRAFGHELAYVADKDTFISRAMRGAIRSEGGKPRFVHKTGTSDMNIVGPVWDCPIFAYGPGDSALDHTPDEHIDLDEYLRAIRVLTQALSRL